MRSTFLGLVKNMLKLLGSEPVRVSSDQRLQPMEGEKVDCVQAGQDPPLMLVTRGRGAGGLAGRAGA